jgi:DNA repair exonuclease SbcCD nuclease subunit
MRLILLSDLHLTCNTPIARLDNIEETWKRKLGFVVRYAVENKLAIIVAGDFFDRPRDWKTLSEVIDLFDSNPEIATVWGQHDLYLYGKDRTTTSLGILVACDKVKELIQYWAGTDNEMVYVYGASWGQEIPVPDSPKDLNILVIHKSISDAPLFPGHEYTNAEMFLKSHPEYKVIVCGDIHRRFFIQKNGRIIVNPGPLLRMEATEYNMSYEPKFAVLDTLKQSVEWIDIPHEPSEKVLTRRHIENKKETESMLDEFIKNIYTDHQITFDFKSNLAAYLSVNKINQNIIDIISGVMNEH